MLGDVGSKGSNQVSDVKNTSQTYTANPLTSAYATYLTGMGQNLPGPGGVPLQGIAGFDPLQQQAYNSALGTLGAANPYFAAGNQYINQSTQRPDTEAFLSPYGDYAYKNWKQYVADPYMTQANARDVASAGGTDASRLALARANEVNDLTNQFGGLMQSQWNNAANQAAAQRQLQQSAGALQYSAGPAAQAAGWGDLSQLFGYGAQGQNTAQNIYNALFNQRMGAYQNPYQNLALQSGLLGTVGGVLGGTTTGQMTDTKTYPQTSPWSYVPGLAMTGVGLATGNPFMTIGGMSQIPGAAPSFFGSNGRITGQAVGGRVDNPYEFADGGEATFDDRWAGLGDTDEAGGLYAMEQGTHAPAASTGAENPFMDRGAFGNARVPLTGGSEPLPGNLLPLQAPDRRLPPAPPDDEPDVSRPPAGPSGQPYGAGIPPVPAFPGRTGVSPWLVAGLASLAGAGARDAHGLPAGGGPFGQALRATGIGGGEGLKFLEKENQADREAAKLWEQATMARLPYQQMTADETARMKQEAARLKQQKEQFERPYNELTEQQRIEAGKPVSLGVDPTTGFEVKGILGDDGKYRIIDPHTGKLREEGDAASGGVGGMTKDSIDAAAERYLKTGTLPPNAGRGVQGRMERTAIQNRAAEMAKERGIKLEDLPAKWQDFRAQQVAVQRFLSGPQGNVIRSLNVVTDHLSTLGELSTALNNGDIVLFNRLAQEWAAQTGNEAPTNFDAAKRIVGAEIIKALGVAGAGTEAERREAGDAFMKARSPQQIEGAITTVQKLLTGQLKGLRQQFKVATGRGEEVFNEMLLPGTLKFLDPKKEEPKKELSAEDKAALKWANDNPKDPRAAAIKKRLGVE